MNKIIKNTIQLFTLVLILATAGCKKKEVDLDKAFVKYYGGLKADAGVDVLQTSDGGYIIAGTSNIGTGSADNYDMILIKTDAHGDEVWHKTFGGPNYDEGGALGIMPDGGYIIVGTFGKTARNWSLETLEVGKDSTEMVGVRVDVLGNTVWQKSYEYSNASVQVGTFGKALVVNEDGTCFLGGMVDSATTSQGNPNLDLFAVIIGQDGALIKVGGIDMKPLHYGANSEQDYMADAILAYSTGGIEYLISSSTTLSGANTPRLVKCRMNGVALTQNNAPSKTQWVPQEADASKLLTGTQVCRTSDFNYMMTGNSGTLPNTDFYMFKVNGISLDNTGMGVLKLYGGDGVDEGVSIIATSDGGYAILATTNSVVYTGAAEKLSDVLLLKVSSTGDVQWSKVFGGTGNDSASRLIQTQDGGYLICGTIAFGESNSGGSNSITLIKVNNQGEISNLK